MINDSIKKLQSHIVKEEYKGYDPYDSLLSPLFDHPAFNNRVVRFGGQQILKRIPINIRGLLQIEKGLNPVTLGLSIQSYTYLARINPGDSRFYFNEIEKLFKLLMRVKSSGYCGISWGYNFDWEARYTKINAYVPTSVATGIITNGLFEYYLLTGDEKYFEVCRDATRFVMEDLNKLHEGDLFCYSYSPNDKQYVYNASLKAARLLSQVYSIEKDEKLRSEARLAVEYAVVNQRSDGSWAYANHDARTWADNYHTGYILDCIDSYMSYTGDYEFKIALEKGLLFYTDNFFTNGRIPKFHSDKLFPIDSTAAAQSLLTLSRFGYLDLASNIANWYIENMQAKSGGFYYRKHKFYTDRTIFMRWSNAWMFVGLTYLLLKQNSIS